MFYKFLIDLQLKTKWESFNGSEEKGHQYYNRGIPVKCQVVLALR